MLHLDRAAPDVQGGRGEALDAKQLEADARADHVHDGVNRADLVEVYALDGNVVDARLGLAQPSENLQRARLDRIVEARVADNLLDVREVSVLLLLARESHNRARRADA